MQHMSVVFPKSEKRTQWEKTFNEVKQKITAALDYHPIPEFIGERSTSFTLHIAIHLNPIKKKIYFRQSVNS